jgi:hypothetical protein
MSKNSHISFLASSLTPTGGSYSKVNEEDNGNELVRTCTNKGCQLYLAGFCNRLKGELISCPLPPQEHMALKMVTKREMIRTINKIKTETFTRDQASSKVMDEKFMELNGSKSKTERDYPNYRHENNSKYKSKGKLVWDADSRKFYQEYKVNGQIIREDVQI